MLPLAITLLTVSLILLALALRGRTTARGLFCRNCKFDLAGLTTPDTCPECGRSLTTAKSTRPTLRRPHKPTLAIALLLLTAGAVLATLSLTRGPTFYAKLPDVQLLLLNRLGVDEALTELAARTTRTPPLSDAHWRTLIARGLAHQADTDTPWDPRWGQVLAHALIQNRLGEPQLRAYLAHAIDARVTIRDRITHDADSVGYWVSWRDGRISTAGPSVPTGLFYDVQIKRAALVGDDDARRGGHSSGGQLTIPSGSTGGWSATGSTIRVPTQTPRDQPVRVFIETTFTLLDANDDPLITIDPVRHEQSVRILPPGEPVVRTVTDPAAAEAIRAAATVSGLTVFESLPADSIPNWGTEAANLQLTFGSRPRAVAGRLYAVLDSGIELELGAVKLPAGEGQHGVGIGLYLQRAQIAERAPALASLAARETVDLVFRTDATAANDQPLIDEAVELTLFFPAVPVTTVKSPDDVDRIAARVHRTPAAAAEAEPPAPVSQP
jgi:hypothetical protein